MEKLVLGIPSGSLYDATARLFEKVGVNARVKGRNFLVDLGGVDIFSNALLMRSRDIPEAIVDGVIDCGICGWDCVVESGLDKSLARMATLPYGKTSSAPVQVAVFGRSGRLDDHEDILVASEFFSLAKRVFSRAKIRLSHGSTEVKVAYGKYHYGVGVVETGTSLKHNGLVLVKTILESPVVLVARERSRGLVHFGELLEAGLRSENYCLLKMNVDPEAKHKLLAILPALSSPTLNVLANGHYAVETTVKKDQVADLIIRLRSLGATGIISHDLNIVM